MKQALVLIHGSGDSSRIWRLQVEHFGPQQVFAIDLPGHGQRPDIFSTEVQVEDYARWVHEIISKELGLQQPIIAGHSLGGAIALQMALTYPDALDGLILIGTGGRLRVHPSLLAEAREQPEAAKAHLSKLATAPTVSATTLGDIAQDQKANQQPSQLYRDLAACNTFDVLDRLYEIRLPTLIICGQEDRLTPVNYSQYVQEHIARAKLHIIEGAGHYVMRERPTAVNKIIEEWLKREGWG